jgi:aryl-alcohol dehydrogenase-like predicted oxidoreductase
MERIRLGKTSIDISLVGIGTWSWGERFIFGGKYQEADFKKVFEASLKAGINFFDTAEVYGRGNSELILGECLHTINSNTKLIIATKFNPRFRFGQAALRNALKNSLKRLGLEKVDLYQIHQPGKLKQWVNAIAHVYEDGLVSAIGVSNYGPEQFKQAYEILEKRGIKLASNQMHYSLLFRKHEFNGLLNTCKELGVTFLAYMPLAQGILTGKYTPDNRPKGFVRSLTYRKGLLKKVQPLIELMREIGKNYGNKTPSQVAINWVICKGAIPLVGINNERQLNELLGASDWRLSVEDVNQLDAISRQQYVSFYNRTFYRFT